MILLIDQSKILPNKWGDRCYALLGQIFKNLSPHSSTSWGTAWYGIQVLKGTDFWGVHGYGQTLAAWWSIIMVPMNEDSVHVRKMLGAEQLTPWDKHEGLKNTNTFLPLLLN